MLKSRHIKIHFSKLKKVESKENEMRLAAQPESSGDLHFLPRGRMKEN